MTYTPTFGLLTCSESLNLGDDIQNIAASKFLPNYDTIIDRNTANTDTEIKTDKIYTIYNGWFDSAFTKFPLPDFIEPYFVSFHINDSNHYLNPLYKRLLEEHKINQKPIAEQTEFFKRFEPIGCRDTHTVNLLQSNGIEAYFSGCLTLTLTNPFLDTERTDEILVVDAHILNTSLFYSLIPKDIQERATYITQTIKDITQWKTKVELAQNFLDRLAKAKVVITSRLHTALPCLAFNTPVIFITSDIDDVRFWPYLKYIKHFTIGDKFDIDIDTFSNPDATELFQIVKQTEIKVKNWITNIDTYTDLNNQPIKNGYSIVTSCMNRQSYLEQTLPTWIASNPDEIIIVDWNSEKQDELEILVKQYSDKAHIKLIRVNNYDKWSLTKSFNLAFRACSFDKVLKLDSDIKLDEKFFFYHNLEKDNNFFCGDWSKARNENEKHTNGVLYVKRNNFFTIGGYNELIEGYGYDDSDLYDRLSQLASRQLICLDLVEHILHSNELRIENTKNKNRLDIEIEKNRLISKELNWNHKFSFFDIKQKTTNRFDCQFVKGQTIDQETEKYYLNKANQNRKYMLQKSKLKLYIEPKNGLGNRLRSLASAYVIAKNTNRSLVLVWIPDEHCQASFFDLFDKNYITKGLTVVDKKDEISKIFMHHRVIDETHSSISFDFSRHSDLPFLDYYNYSKYKNEYIKDESSDDIYVVSACVLNNRNTNWYQESIFLRHLVPKEEILNKVFETEFKYNSLKNVVGVHIRMGQDPVLYAFEDVSKYNDREKSLIQRWRQASNWKNFVPKMEELIKLNSDQRFYISADNKQVYIEFQKLEQFKDKLIFTARDTYDRNIEDIKSALVDLYLLSKCKLILGSNWSSFTEIAHKIGLNEMLLIGK